MLSKPVIIIIIITTILIHGRLIESLYLFFSIAIDCGTLPSFDNGVIRYSVTTTLASFVRYSCNIGFMIVGMDIRICLTNGTWSGVSPTCQSEYNYEHNNNDQYKYKCNSMCIRL